MFFHFSSSFYKYENKTLFFYFCSVGHEKFSFLNWRVLRKFAFHFVGLVRKKRSSLIKRFRILLYSALRASVDFGINH